MKEIFTVGITDCWYRSNISRKKIKD